MKKSLKMMAALSALLAMLGFVSCSSDDDDDDDGSSPQTTTETGGSGTTTTEGTGTTGGTGENTTEGTGTTGGTGENTTGGTGTTTTEKTVVVTYNFTKQNKITSTKALDDTFTAVVAGTNVGTKSMQGYDIDKDAGTGYMKMTANGLSYNSKLQYGIKFTVSKTSDIKITATTKESTTLSGEITGQWGLVEASDSIPTDTPDPKYTSTGTPVVASSSSSQASDTPAELTFTDVAAGTYILNGIGKGGYLYSITISQ